MKYCHECGNELKDEAKFCDKCGTKIDNILPTQKFENKSNQKPKKKYGCLIAVIVIITMVIMMVIVGMIASTQSTKLPQNINILMKNGIDNEDKAVKVDSILKQCGIEIKSINHDEGLDNATGVNEKGYRVSTGDGNNVILYLTEDDNVLSVKYANNLLYKDNKVVKKLSDYTLTLNEASDLQYKSQEMVKQILKAPSTAKFPNINNWAFSKNPKKIIIQSYVDSENSFGAMIRSEFQITLTSDGKTVSSFIFEGQEQIKQ